MCFCKEEGEEFYFLYLHKQATHHIRGFSFFSLSITFLIPFSLPLKNQTPPYAF